MLNKLGKAVDRDTGIEMWRGLIEVLNSVGISKKKREEIYLLMFGVFADQGFDDFDLLVSDQETDDPAYDSAYKKEYE